MTSFRQPSTVAFEPYPPNQLQWHQKFCLFDDLFLRFNIEERDRTAFYSVVGQLGGTINIILQLPVIGTVQITGSGLSVSAFLDIQKSMNDQPYLRMTQCRIDGGIIDTRVADMGLLTDTINAKYHSIMSAQSKTQLEEAICENIYRLTQQHFSSRLSKLPTQINARTLFMAVFTTVGVVIERSVCNEERKSDI
ncbi:unnamed protein product [Nippostrongylus brasiliensis]|uniref:BPI1 domain-containing protein n=1 Tax=Nippostrongylus brasiliensis TaxID=27835 RepID=A0A0N4YVQ0_NIPBR|nr:unnamed protein product [Nippostrongylus brasiliensis]